MVQPIANNPLAKHFRQPAIYLKLPSNGKYYPQDSIELTVTGEIPVYPMTIKDEVLLKTPDALMNGEGMAEMIRSCCPSIKDVWHMPLVDLDAVLIAIRIASYGPGMDITSTCTHCGSDNEHTVDLRNILDNIVPVTNYDSASMINGLVFKLKPQSFKDINRLGIINFEQQKLMAVISNSDLPNEEKQTRFKDSFDRLTVLNIDTLVSCISSITTEEGVVVSDRQLIVDFLVHTDRKTYDDIKDLVSATVEANALQNVTLPCSECKESYNVKLEFNQSSFFE